MQNYTDDELDEDGRRKRRKRVLPDGAREHFRMELMDHARIGFSPTFADGSHDFTSPHRPGHRFADVNSEARIAAHDAYEQRRERMSNAWRNKGDAQRKPPAGSGRQPVTSATLDEARALADRAYEQRRAGLHYTNNRHRQQDAPATERPSPRPNRSMNLGISPMKRTRRAADVSKIVGDIAMASSNGEIAGVNDRRLR